MTKHYNTIILGAGPAGYSCGIKLAKAGQKVLLIERDYVGGICTNWGCTPSKAMIYSSKIIKSIKEAKKYGIDVEHYSIDFDTVRTRRDEVIENVRTKIKKAIDHSGAEIIQGEGEVTKWSEIDKKWHILVKKGTYDMISDKMNTNGEEYNFTSDNVVISTGSEPTIPPFANKDDKSIISSNKLISINKLPEKLTIVGGGFIGMEFATIFNHLGVKVTVVEYCERILSWCDPEISQYIHNYLSKEGIKIITNAKVNSIKNGIVTYADMSSEGAQIKTLDSELNLISIGRKPVLREDKWQTLGLNFSNRGIEINQYQQTNLPNMWAIGDATGKSILAHVGIRQGVVAAESILKTHNIKEIDYSNIPAVVYTLPEICMVGTVPKNDENSNIKNYSLSFENNLRAEIEGQTTGFIKIWVEDDLMIAAQCIGYCASEMVQQLANIIQFKTPVSVIANEIAAHPTYGELVKTVCEYACGIAIEVVD